MDFKATAWCRVLIAQFGDVGLGWSGWTLAGIVWWWWVVDLVIVGMVVVVKVAF